MDDARSPEKAGWRGDLDDLETFPILARSLLDPTSFLSEPGLSPCASPSDTASFSWKGSFEGWHRRPRLRVWMSQRGTGAGGVLSPNSFSSRAWA